MTKTIYQYKYKKDGDKNWNLRQGSKQQLDFVVQRLANLNQRFELVVTNIIQPKC